MYELLEIYSDEVETLNKLKFEYDALKKHVELLKLEKKYSNDYFNLYKTIKEKEERAVLDTQDEAFKLINLKNDLRKQELTVELLKIEIKYKIASEN